MRTSTILAGLTCVLLAVDANGAPDTAQADALYQQAYGALQAQRLDDADRDARRALALYEQNTGADSLHVATALDLVAAVQAYAGRHAAAEPMLLRSLSIRERALGASHPHVTTSLQSLVSLYSQLGNGAKALEYQRRLVGAAEQQQGADSGEALGQVVALAQAMEGNGAWADAYPLRQRVVDAVERLPEMQEALPGQLAALAENCKQRGAYADAEKHYRRALALVEKSEGAASDNAATLVNNLAETLRERGSYADAAPLYARAMKFHEEKEGADSLAVATVANNHALLLKAQGRYDDAERLFRRSLAIREAKLGSSHLDVGYPLNNLAELLRLQARHAEAEPLYRRAIAIREQHLGAAHPLVATTLQNLALLHVERGNDVEAQQLFNRALDAYQGALGPDHVLVANTLTNMASLARTRGNLVVAQQHLQRALAIQEKALGPDHALVGNTINSLGLVAQDAGEIDAAETLFRRGLETRTRALGADHVDVAMSRVNLAAVEQERGHHAAAVALNEQAIKVFTRALGKSHPLVAQAQHNIGVTHARMGDNAAAARMLRTALAAREASWGRDSPQVAETLHQLATVHHAMGALVPAREALRRVVDIREGRVPVAMAAGSDEEKRIYNESTTGEVQAVLSVDRDLGTRDVLSRRLALTAVLRWKARALDVMSDALGSVRARLSAEDVARLDELGEVRTRMGALALRGAGPEGEQEHRRALQALEGRADRLESELGARSSEYRATFEPVTLERVQAAIPADAVLVEYVLFFPAVRQASTRTLKWEAPRYLVYLLRAVGDPDVVDLGSAEEIEAPRRALVKALMSGGREDARAAARALDERVMRPVRARLGDTRKLLVAPDGGLHLVPLGALVDEDNRFLIERFDIAYLASGRDLLRMDVVAAPGGEDVLVADPAFDHAAHDGGTRTRGVAGDMTFEPLPGTADEVTAIAALLPDARVVKKRDASEAMLKGVQAPRILHVATHGFFRVEDAPATGGGGTRGLVLKKEARPARPPLPADALLRSGLALAGANRGGDGAEDGILTAAEVSGMNLWGTELVVLSACETGLGEVVLAEGVLGLRRALVMSGSRSQAMSLWNVDDDATRALMTAFYTRLNAGAGRAEAMRAAQLQLLSNRATQHPYFWAAFITAGDWRPLPRKRASP